MSRFRRLDAELVRRKMARSRQHAAELIAAGRVKVAGAVATKPATQIDPAVGLHVLEGEDGPDYASRGAHKLISALDAFSGIVVAGRDALDAGASTGGFTDVLLRRGINRVIAADVGYGQLIWSLQQDERVHVMDRTNVRTLTPEDLPFRPSLVVSDLSFISLTLVMPALIACCTQDGDLVLMVKPQFEVGKDRLGSGGVVRSPELRAESVLKVAASAAELGWGVAGVVASGLPGPSGNVEYFLHLRADAAPISADAVAAAVAAGPQ